MQPVSEPEIIAFLHHVAVHHPELRGLAGLPPEYVAELIDKWIFRNVRVR
jgi:hypothetical protein